VHSGINIEAMLTDAGRKQRVGRRQAGVISDGNWPIIYDGRRIGQALGVRQVPGHANVKLKGAQTTRRTRPVFREWSLKFTVSYLPDIINRTR